MAQNHPPQTTPLPVRRWDTTKIFRMLKDPFRRQIIRSMALGGMKTAKDANAGSGKKRHASVKHFSLLHKAGILVQKANPNDGRQPLYVLASAAVVSHSADFMTVDFGCCMLRFAKTTQKAPLS